MIEDPRDWLHAFLERPEFYSRYPYYASVLARMAPVLTSAVEVMAVGMCDRRLWLLINREYFQRHPQFLPGVLLHETHHVVLGHISDPRFRGVVHPDVMEIAAEISANEFIEEALPRHIGWRDYFDRGLRSGQSTMERYELLVAARERGLLVTRPAPPTLDDHFPPGALGVGAGALRPDTGALARTASLLRDSITDLPAGTNGLLAGQEPGEILEALEHGRRRRPPAFLDWRSAMQLFVHRNSARTWQRPNRRFPDRVGEIPGRTYQTGPAERLALLVAIDTSGSMTTEELHEIAAQLGLLRCHAEMTIVECDAAIQRVYPFRGELLEVQGRGGTNLSPVFDPALWRAHGRDGIVFFTDGLGPFPERNPGVRTLWVLTKPEEFTCPWGDKARLRVQESIGHEPDNPC